LYSGNRFSTQHDARQRSPALIVLKEENNNNNNTIHSKQKTLIAGTFQSQPDVIHSSMTLAALMESMNDETKFKVCCSM